MNPSATSTPSCSFKRAESDSVVVDVSRRQIRNSKAETNEVISKRHSGAQLGASCFGRGCCGPERPALRRLDVYRSRCDVFTSSRRFEDALEDNLLGLPQQGHGHCEGQEHQGNDQHKEPEVPALAQDCH